MTREELLNTFTVGVKFQPLDTTGKPNLYLEPVEVKPNWKLFYNNRTGNSWFESFDGHLGMAHLGYVQVGKVTAKILEP